MTRVLVTGASGFLGGAIWRRLTEREDLEAKAAARDDLADAASVARMLSAWKPEVVVHAAGRTHGSKDELHADNVALTQRLAQALATTSADTRLILLSSAAQYGPSPDQVRWREDADCQPLNAYGAAKLEAER